MALASFNVKARRTTMSLGKSKTEVKGKRLTDPALFPITLQARDPDWKLRFGYDQEKAMFTLAINGVPFLLLPYQATTEPQGPQNIESGQITLNGTEILPDGMLTGWG